MSTTSPRGTVPVLLALLLAGPVDAQNTPSLAPDDVEVGARGHGLSVFTGTEIERFEVEVLGLMRNPNPDTSFILARLTGHGLESSGVVGGMSGSPVYIDGKLTGAIAFGWSFANEAIAGITPIAAMRGLADFPTEPAPAGRAHVDLERLLRRDLPATLLTDELERISRRMGSNNRSNLTWATVGLDGAAQSTLVEAFGGLAPAGTSLDLDAELEPGSAVAGVLMDGDLRMAFSGTVTERRDDEILAFGHSFMGLGALELPMATSEVVTVLSSRSSSFKIANIGPVVGAFSQDRFAGMRGQLGATAPTIPAQVRVLGEPAKTYNLELATLPQMMPTMVATAILQALDAARRLNGDQDLDLRARFDLKGHESLAVEQSFDGQSAAIGGAIYALSLVSFLVNNADEAVQITGIDIELEQYPKPVSATLLKAHAERLAVRPGDTVAVHLDLREYRGDEVRRTVEIEIPPDARGGPYYLFAGDGASVDALKQQIAPQAAARFEEALTQLRAQRSSRDFVVLGVSPGPGLVVDGQALPWLPESMRSIWKAAGPLASTSLNLAIRQEIVERPSTPIVGAARIDLRVADRLD